VAGDLEPGFRGDVLGVGGAGQGGQVAQQAGLEVAVEQPERLAVTLPRPRQRLAEFGVVLRLRLGPGTGPGRSPDPPLRPRSPGPARPGSWGPASRLRLERHAG